MNKAQNEMIEKRLKGAIEQMVPDDMYDKITQSIACEERIRIMDNQNLQNAVPKTKRHKVTKWISIAAAACIIFAGGLAGGGYYSNNIAIDSIVDIDVNPGIEITTNKKNVVLDVTAINKDAEKVLDGMNLKNTDLKVAVNAIVGSMVQQGYLIDGENSILVTVQNDDKARAEYVRNMILKDLDGSLKANNISAAVVNQTVQKSDEVSDIAKDEGISFGKAYLIQNLCSKDKTLKASELANMSLRQIAKLVSERGIDISDIVDYDIDDSVWENIEDAVEDANEYAFENQNQNQNASQGSQAVKPNQTNKDNDLISLEKAKEIALKHAGVSAKDVWYEKAHLDTDDGIKVYDIDFIVNDNEYDFEINAITGEIHSYSTEKLERDDYIDDDRYDDDRYDDDVVIKDTTKDDLISASKAKDIALKHAGLSESSVTFIKAELDRDDGRTVYEIEFFQGNMEYEYEINAQNGNIVSYDSEYDD